MRQELAPAAAKAPSDDATARAQNVDRKRVRKVALRLAVHDVLKARGAFETLITTQQGFLESLDTNGQGTATTVRGVARVPDANLDGVVARVRSLGRVLEESQETKDVTRQFVDTDARLRNLTRTEERLLDLLAQSGSSLADVLAVERELTRVRGEIEQITSELRALEHDVQLAQLSVDLTSDEPEALAGPDDAWRPLRILKRDAWAIVATSAGALIATAAFLLRTALAALPWIPILFVAWISWRWVRRRRRGSAA
jgi:hypothetical protein